KLLADDSETYKRGAEFIVQQWHDKLGVDVEVDAVPFKLRLDRSEKHDFDIVLSDWVADYNDPMTFLDMFQSDSEFDNGGFKDPDYDSMIQAAKAEADPDKRMIGMHKAESLLIDHDMAIAPLLFRAQSYLRKPYIKGWIDHSFGPAYDLKYVYVEGK
ncbi:MAG: ABC transporter substrate-binding protein, partial [Tumebacillaceae bacterium]